MVRTCHAPERRQLCHRLIRQLLAAFPVAFVQTQAFDVMVHVRGMVIHILPLGLHPPAVMAPGHAFVLVLPPEWWNHEVVLEEVARLVHQRWIPPVRQVKPLAAPVVPVH